MRGMTWLLVWPRKHMVFLSASYGSLNSPQDPNFGPFSSWRVPYQRRLSFHTFFTRFTKCTSSFHNSGLRDFKHGDWNYLSTVRTRDGVTGIFLLVDTLRMTRLATTFQYGWTFPWFQTNHTLHFLELSFSWRREFVNLSWRFLLVCLLTCLE